MPVKSSSGSYVGRFAPSPTGPLHLGSLLAALASFLDARANGGNWLLRMEDLDPPRQSPGAADLILKQLDSLHLHWDGAVLYQSTRAEAYRAALQQLQKAGLCYHCNCSRARVRQLGSVYDGKCRARTTLPPQTAADATNNVDTRDTQRAHVANVTSNASAGNAQQTPVVDVTSNSSTSNAQQTPAANTTYPANGEYSVRLHTPTQQVAFDDLILGRFAQHLQQEVGDFVIQRKDSLFAYQLAVVVDDAFQKISHVIRGHDLLDSTPRQLYLQQQLDLPHPTYGHIPVIVNAEGQKLSKQHFAPAINAREGSRLIYQALLALGQTPPGATTMPITELLEWGIAHWDIEAVPRLATIPLDEDTAIIRPTSKS
ncbi:MAG: glutamyl-Q tRNA(Asp) synthetase [Pseudohongiellaceae bacterium]